MIFYFIFLTVVPHFCEMFYYIHKDSVNVIITKVNVDLFTIKKGAFRGINHARLAEICEHLGKTPLIPFEPLPIKREYLKVLFANKNSSPPHDPTSRRPEDIPSSSNSQNMASSSQSENIASSSNSTNLTFFLDQSNPSKKKNRTVVDEIYLNENNIRVTAAGCTFNDFRLFLIPVELLAGYILVLDIGYQGENIQYVPLGYTLKRISFRPVLQSNNQDIINSWFSDMSEEQKKPRVQKEVPVLYSPMESGTDMSEMKKLKNIQLCSSIYIFVDQGFFVDGKILTAEMTYVSSPEVDSLKCHAGLDAYQIFERPTFERRIFLLRQILIFKYETNYLEVLFPGFGRINL